MGWGWEQGLFTLSQHHGNSDQGEGLEVRARQELRVDMLAVSRASAQAWL